MSEEIARRDLLRNIALAAALGGVEPAAAQHVHQIAAADKATSGGTYAPKVFQAGEWAALDALCELIVPGARKAGAKEFVDLISSANPVMAALWTGGLAWMNTRLGKPFAEATPAAQTALLDQIAFRKNLSPDLAPGVTFFDVARRMVVDAYYTSAVGVAELGYKGNVGMSDFKVPDEAITYALRRSNLG